MMNVFLQAAAVADTLAGGNPVLPPLASGEPLMNLLEMAMKGGWIMLVLALCLLFVFIFSSNVWHSFVRRVRKTLCSWNASVTISVVEK